MMKKTLRKKVIPEYIPGNQSAVGLVPSAPFTGANANQKRKQDIASVAIAVPNSNYHSLDSIVSSDSRDDDDCGSSFTIDLALLDKEQDEDDEDDEEKEEEKKNHITRLRKRSSMLSTTSDSVAMPPPPPKTPPPSSLRFRNKLNNIPTKTNSSGVSPSSSPNSESFHAKNIISNSQTDQQNKTLVSLLQEMRTLENRSSQHAIERSILLETLSQKSAYTKQLEDKLTALQKQNDTLEKQLGIVFTKLERFATGCWRFPSSSVKKMSEALHIQVQEWRHTYPHKTSSHGENQDIVRTPENEALARSTMEKLQSFHLESKQLKEENQRLKAQLKRIKSSSGGRSKKRGNATMANGGGSGSGCSGGDDTGVAQVSSGIDSQSDEVSHMSGVTQISHATKLVDAMSTFLNEDDQNPQSQLRHEGHEQQHKQQQQQSRTTSSAPLTTSERLSSSSPKRTPRHSNKPTPSQASTKSLPSTINKSPQSILKNKMSCKYADQHPDAQTKGIVSTRLNTCGHRVSLPLHQIAHHNTHQPGKQQQSRQQQVKQAHNGRQYNHRQHHHHEHKYQERRRARITMHDRPPRSPKKQMDCTRVPTVIDSFGFDDNAIALGLFPNPYKNDFVTEDDTHYHKWISWGDEESEV